MSEFPGVVEDHRVMLKDLRPLARVVNYLLKGKTNNTGTVTITASTTTTTVTDARLGADSVILLSPLTANAAAAIGTTYISTVTAGASFVLTHANNAQTDRDFAYIIVG